MTTNPLPILTVVVCTHNRLKQLERCLNSLSEQNADSSKYEVLVVNNASTDGTRDFLECCTYDQIQFRWINEEISGLSHARNRGWLEARGAYVAYIDDDAEATPHWITEIFEFVGRHPEVAMFGGPFEAYTDEPIPGWFPPEYGSMDLGSEERAIDIGQEFIVGLNMVFRKNILVDCGGFHPDLGMKGEKVSYGEETQLQYLFRDKCLEVYYLPRMKVRHYLPAYKMHWWWLIKSVFSVGTSWALTSNCSRSLFGHLAGLAYGSVYALKTLIKSRNMPFLRKLYYAVIPFVSECGAFIEYFRAK